MASATVDSLIKLLTRVDRKTGAMRYGITAVEQLGGSSIRVVMMTSYGRVSLILEYRNGFDSFPSIRLENALLHPRLGLQKVLPIERLYHDDKNPYYATGLFFTDLERFFTRPSTSSKKDRRFRLDSGKVLDIDELARLIIKQDYNNRDDRDQPIWRNIEELCNIVYHPLLDRELQEEIFREGVINGALEQALVEPFTKESENEFKNNIRVLTMYPAGEIGKQLDHLQTGKNVIQKLVKFLEYVAVGRSLGYTDPAIIERMRNLYVHLHQDESNTSGLDENIAHVKYILSMLKRKFKGDTDAMYTELGKITGSIYCLDGLTERIISHMLVGPDFKKNKIGALGEVFQTIHDLACEEIGSWRDFEIYGTKDKIKASFYNHLDIKEGIRNGYITQRDVEDFFNNADYGWTLVASRLDDMLDCEGKFDKFSPTQIKQRRQQPKQVEQKVEQRRQKVEQAEQDDEETGETVVINTLVELGLDSLTNRNKQALKDLMDDNNIPRDRRNDLVKKAKEILKRSD